eukprot:scaffold189241_cov31-Prasinocladus_malaysianus.AAC.1
MKAAGMRREPTSKTGRLVASVSFPRLRRSEAYPFGSYAYVMKTRAACSADNPARHDSTSSIRVDFASLSFPLK